MENNEIKHGTPEWYEARAKTLGSSEIYSFVMNVISADDLEKLGYDPAEIIAEMDKDKESVTVKSRFEIIKSKAELTQVQIARMFSQYGNMIEQGIVDIYNAKNSTNFELGGSLCSHDNGVSTCTPDSQMLVDGKVQINEIKTVLDFITRKGQKPASHKFYNNCFKYTVQLMYQHYVMACSNDMSDKHIITYSMIDYKNQELLDYIGYKDQEVTEELVRNDIVAILNYLETYDQKQHKAFYDKVVTFISTNSFTMSYNEIWTGIFDKAVASFVELRDMYNKSPREVMIREYNSITDTKAKGIKKRVELLTDAEFKYGRMPNFMAVDNNFMTNYTETLKKYNSSKKELMKIHSGFQENLFFKYRTDELILTDELSNEVGTVSLNKTGKSTFDNKYITISIDK